MAVCSGPCQPALSFTQLEQVWTSSGGTAAMAPVMAAIALAESSGIPNNTNPTDNGGRQTSWGLWQVSQGNHNAYANWADPTANAKVAQSKLATQGLTAWGTWNSGAAKAILNQNLGSTNAALTISSVSGGGASTSSGGSTSASGGASIAGGSADEGTLFNVSFGIGSLSMKRSTARHIVGATVLVGGGVVALAGVFVLVGAGKKLPGPVGAVQGALQSRKEGRQEEAMVTGRAEGRQRRAVQETENRRRAANRREAEEAVAERQRQNRDAQRQEDALQRIEARRLASASNVRRATPGAGRERTAPRRSRPQGSGKGNF